MSTERIKVLITGANGFVGAHVMQCFEREGHEVIGSVRHAVTADSPYVQVSSLGNDTQWQSALRGVEIVVHTAAHVHVMKASSDDATTCHQVNVLGTLNLARQALASGCRRFVYLSSIKVNGERTHDTPFSADDVPQPQGVYAHSKYDAECELQALVAGSDMELVIVRPPLVYGRGVKANVQQLIRAVTRGIPLPLARVDNQRSLVGVDNLCDFIHVCATHPHADGEIFLVSDGRDVSTRELVTLIANALSTRARLFSMPHSVLRFVARCVKQEARLSRVFDSLQVNIDKNTERLSWVPPFTMEQQMRHMVSVDESEHLK